MISTSGKSQGARPQGLKPMRLAVSTGRLEVVPFPNLLKRTADPTRGSLPSHDSWDRPPTRLESRAPSRKYTRKDCAEEVETASNSMAFRPDRNFDGTQVQRTPRRKTKIEKRSIKEALLEGTLRKPHVPESSPVAGTVESFLRSLDTLMPDKRRELQQIKTG
jgi:hypothetical protein